MVDHTFISVSIYKIKITSEFLMYKNPNRPLYILHYLTSLNPVNIIFSIQTMAAIFVGRGVHGTPLAHQRRYKAFFFVLMDSREGRLCPIDNILFSLISAAAILKIACKKLLKDDRVAPRGFGLCRLWFVLPQSKIKHCMYAKKNTNSRPMHPAATRVRLWEETTDMDG